QASSCSGSVRNGRCPNVDNPPNTLPRSSCSRIPGDSSRDGGLRSSLTPATIGQFGWSAGLIRVVGAHVVGVAAQVVVPELLAVHPGRRAGDAALAGEELVAFGHEAGAGMPRAGGNGPGQFCA